MYKRNLQGWMKHLDFILWDLLILQVSFILGYMIRHGWGEMPYLQPSYRSLAIILTAVDILVAETARKLVGVQIGIPEFPE